MKLLCAWCEHLAMRGPLLALFYLLWAISARKGRGSSGSGSLATLAPRVHAGRECWWAGVNLSRVSAQGVSYRVSERVYIPLTTGTRTKRRRMPNRRSQSQGLLTWEPDTCAGKIIINSQGKLKCNDTIKWMDWIRTMNRVYYSTYFHGYQTVFFEITFIFPSRKGQPSIHGNWYSYHTI